MKDIGKILGKLIVNRAKFELKVDRKINGKKVRRIASKTLLNSLSFVQNGTKVNFQAVSYGVFIHYGVNGTQKKYGAPFSYSNKMPPTKPIEEWLKVKGVRLRKVVDRNGTKVNTFVKNTDENRKQASFAIAKGIQKNGIAPVPYYNNAIRFVLENKEDMIEQAMLEGIDLILDL